MLHIPSLVLAELLDDSAGRMSPSATVSIACKTNKGDVQGKLYLTVWQRAGGQQCFDLVLSCCMALSGPSRYPISNHHDAAETASKEPAQDTCRSDVGADAASALQPSCCNAGVTRPVVLTYLLLVSCLVAVLELM